MSSGLVIEYSRSIYKVHEISDHTLGYYSNKRVVLIVNKGKAIDCVFLELYVYIVFAGSVLWTEKTHRTELNRTAVRSFFRLWLPKFCVVPVAGCLI
ncbi:hypothetical protein K443DRAFT_91854 [Laccaria amethystina LaAM-08-1]|uniref:Unplaced genomic scaffold K443scaffold_28, whole genome shotgun sequence n=1 Tax=Laccaria amethystina LaAM-08-1 TaxID=1095629 RepID=A0A0C9Y4P9_9AGAR|nr:hypothetical protein K443DRAFT_91854 [Laccaria amethystina LaAM-08-1]